MTEEQWRPVPGWEDTHEVSDLGRVRTRRRRGTPGGLVSGWIAGNGYLMVSLSRRGVRKSDYVHRVVARAFLGPCPDGQEVRHRDGDPLNPALSNLAYSTHRRNLLDKREHGTDHNATKTHCLRGHSLSDAYVRPGFRNRQCRTCQNDGARTRRAARKAARSGALPG